MLEEMRIRGLGVIDDAVLELSEGLTVLTGETGAGKTIVITGLGLLFGGRADSALVRSGADRALVEGRLTVPVDSPALSRALEGGAELDGEALILGRTVTADGRSRAYVGGASAPVSLLAELGEDLVAVHGQHDQQRLLRPARQRRALDRYAAASLAGAVAELLGRYRDGYDRLRAVLAELAEITERAGERAREAEALRLGLAEVDQVAPQPGEDVLLAAELERLQHADTLRTAAATAHETLLGDPSTGTGVDVSTLLGSARRALDQARDHDGDLAALADRLAEVGYLLADVAADLASYADRIDVDPLRLEAALARQAALSALTRTRGGTVEGILAWAQQAGLRLLNLEQDDERVGALTDERDRLRTELGRLAGELSAARQSAARRFGDSVTAELTALAMPHARLVVEVRQTVLDAGAADALAVGDRLLAYGPEGVDEVELLLVPHPGAPARPIGRGASGGELSRIMLAVQVVFAGADPVPTFVFDEVDAGVGGRAAVEVGRRLAQLARNAQVLVVTHLPQVAAFADRHLKVDKTDDGRVTRSGVVALEGAQRVRELSRMLAGLEDSSSAQAHAEELLDAATAAKGG